MDKKLLSSLNNLSTALETISDLLSKKSDKKTDTAKALSSGDLSKQFEKLSKSIKEGIESNKSQNKNAPKDTGLGNLSKKLNEIGNSVKNLLSSSKQILSMQKSISETKPEVIVSVEKLKVPPMKPIEIPLRYGKLEPLKLPIPKPIDLTFSKLKSPTLPEIKAAQIPLNYGKLPKTPTLPKLSPIDIPLSFGKLPKIPTLPKLKSIEVPLTFGKLPKTPTLPKLSPIDIPLSFGKLPKLPTLPKFPKIELGFNTPKLPKMPPLPKEHKIDLSFNKPTLPKLPKPKPVIVDVEYKKTTKKPTIEKAGKEENDGGLFGKSGDPKAKKNIKDGVTMILLIAAGVIAIGLAFKIVGGVNIASVIALSLAISVLAVAFSKLAEQKDLTPGRAAGLTAVLVGISLAVMLSSLILSAVKPVGFFQMFTAIMIAGMFTVISYGLGNLLLGMSKITGKSLLMIPLLPFIMVGISMAITASSFILGAIRPIGLFQAITAILIAGMFSVVSYGIGNLLTGLGKLNSKSIAFIPLLPLVLIAISAAIVGSSYLLGAVKPIGLFQAITAIFIAAVFATISFGLGKLLKGFEGMDPTKSAVMAVVLPILLIAISAAILGSSLLLAGVKPIGLFQAFTAILIGIVFIPISYAVPQIAKGIKDLNVAKVALIPIVMVAMALTIMLSSYLLANVKVVPFSKLMSALGISIVLAAIGLGMGFVFDKLSKYTKKSMVDGGINLAIIAAAVVVSSLILSLGKYDKYPTIDWIFFAGIALVGFGYAIVSLNKLGLKPTDIIKGGISVLAIATTIYLTSLILSKGTYDKYPSLTWDFYTAVSLVIFGAAIYALNKIGLGPTDVIKGGISVLAIATTIYLTSLILNKGTYDKYPSLTWDFYTAVSLVVFGSAIYALNKIGLGPTDVIKGGISVLAIAGTIMATSHILAKGDYSLYPPVEWALESGVSLVIFGTAIYAINKFSKPTDIIKGAISVLLIAGTIAATSHILAMGDYSKSPPLDWTLNVAASMIPFGIAAVLLGTIATSGIGAIAIAAGLVAILAVAATVVATDAILSMGNYSKSPPLDWTLNVAASMIPFGAAAVALGTIAISGIGAVAIAAGLVAILAVAGAVVATDAILATGNYSKYPSLDWSKSVSLTMAAFATGMTVLGGIIVASFGVGAVALAAGAAAVLGVAETIVEASNILAKGNFTGGPTEQWAKGIAISLGAFSGVYTMLAKNAIFSLFGGGGIGPKEFGESIVTIADSINIAAEKLSKGNFTGGPDIKWASGVAIAIGAFGQVYKMLLDNAGPAFFSSGVSPEQFSSAIVTVSQGINDSAAKLSTGTFTGGPTKEWAEGVSLALGGFSPIYKILADNAGVWKSGVSAQDFSNAIVSISQGIVDAAFILSTGTVAYVNGPKKEWSEGVSIALQGFTGIFQALNANSGWFTSALKPEDYKKAIQSTGEGLVAAAKAIGGEGVVYDVTKVPDKVWGEKITGAFMAFIPALKYINEQSGWFSNGAEKTVENMAAISTAIKDASITLALGNYTTIIDPNWSNGIKLAVDNFLGILKMMSEQDFDYDDEYAHLKSTSNVLVSVSTILSRGKYVEIPKTYLDSVKSNITTFVNLLTFLGKSDIDGVKLEQVKQLSTSIKNVSLILSQGNFSKMIPKPWMDSVRTNLLSFSQMIKSFDSGGFLSMFSDSTNEKVTELANGIIELAKVFNENKVPFDIKKVPSMQWSQGFSTAITAIIPGLNYISENSGFLSSGEDKFKSGVSAIADALVSVSKKLALGKFDKIINPNYFKNLSENINSYINIIKSVEDSNADYESVSDMADSMVELAKAYDSLGLAIEGLNGQLGAVDLEKMTMLKNLTGSVVMLSLMDSDQFSSMMDALEEKAKILLDVIKDTESSATKEGSTPAAPTTAGAAGGKAGGGAKVSTTPVKTAAPKESQSDKMMQELSASLSGLQSAVSQIAGVIAGGSGVSLKTYMESKMKTEKKPLGS